MRARPDNETPLAYIALLQKSKTPEEAVTFTAYVLPRRKAVWWGHQCLIERRPPPVGRRTRQMLQLAEDWVREPEEELRYRAMNEAMAARDKTPGVWIALAAGWSGGSLSRAGPAARAAAARADPARRQHRDHGRPGQGRRPSTGRRPSRPSSTWASASLTR